MLKQVRGNVEFCDQHAIRGWTNAPSLEVFVNGEFCGRASREDVRDDIVAEGVEEARNFRFVFPSPLWLADRVTLRLSNNCLLAPEQGNTHLERLMLLVSGFDFTRPGLEFGPLDRPTIPRRHAQVFYVDHKDQQGLKDKFAHMPEVDQHRIVSIDYVLTKERSLGQMVQDRKFGWVLGSHVAEHIADFIGWLVQIEAVLEEGGCVALALPHGERTFDACRAVSTFEDLVAAYIMKLDRPSPRQVLSHVIGVSEWSGTNLKEPRNEAGLRNAIELARHVNAGDYVDVHCNVFTPKSFVQIYEPAQRCGLVGLKLSSVVETDGKEFFVHLLKAS